MVTPVRKWERQVYDFLDEPVPDDVREHGVKIVANVLAAGVAGSAMPGIREVGRSGSFAEGPATVWGTDRRVSPTEAAMLNATASVAPEIEEGHNHGGHVGATTVAGAFALAEARDIDGATLVDSVVKAYEVFVRLESAITRIKGQLNDAVPWEVRNPHATWTTVGPALAGGLCLGMDADRLADTLRIAANQAVVSMHDPYREGGTVRNYMAGFSAQTGVTAALSTEAGLEGPESPIREVYDPLRDCEDPSFDRAFDELGDVWESTRNYFKFVPSCRFTQPPLDALCDIGIDIDPTAVERIDVYTFGRATSMDYPDPGPQTSAKFSTPYVLARALVTGEDLWLADFSREAVEDPVVQNLSGRITVHEDEEYETAYPERYGARVTVTLTDGTTLTGDCLDPEGDYRNYPGDDELKATQERLFEVVFEDGTVPLEAVFALPRQEVRSVGATLQRS